MKQLGFSVLLLLVVLVTGSCKKVVMSNWTNASITFKVDGTPKEAKGEANVFAFYAKEPNILQIIGNIGGSEDEQIALTLNEFHGVGEYSVETDFLGIYSLGEESSYVGTEGKIKITEYTEGKSIKGEFQFKGEFLIITPAPNNPATDKVISEGKFEAKVSAYSGPVIEPV
jgi:hypothetical protein